MNQPLILHTFSVSHFSEKARWALDACAVAYREQPWVPFFHILPALAKGRSATTVPVLKTPEGYLQDSTRILRWLEKQGGLAALLPAGEAALAQAWTLEDQYDRIGAHVIRYAYSSTIGDAESVLPLWTIDATPLQARLLRISFPLLSRGFRRLLQIRPAEVARSRQRIDQALGEIEARLAQGHRYLAGDAFSIADLTAAALLAPLACPDQHPVYSRADFKRGVAPLLAGWQDRAGLNWVRTIYRQHRR